MEMDLFQYPELIPVHVKALFDIAGYDGLDYEQLSQLQKDVGSLGYTFEFYLDAVPFNLKKI